MDSSSDDSFNLAWTDASADSLSSDEMAIESMNAVQSEDESVSGEVYKKQLQEELFARSNEHLPNGEHKHKKRKHKVTEEQSDTEHAPKKKKIKREPESDVDAALPKCKMGSADHNEHHSSYDESFLNLKVKAEEHQFVAPSPTIKQKIKNKLKCDSIDEKKLTLESVVTDKKIEINVNLSEEMELDEDNLNRLVQEESNHCEKKSNKKKKKSKNKKDSTSEEVSEPTEAEVKEVNPSPPCTPLAAEESDASSQGDTLDESHTTQNSDRSSNSTITYHEKHEDIRQPSTLLNTNASFSVPSDAPKRKLGMSERLQFEEDDDLDPGDGQVQSNIAPAAKSSKIKSYLNDNSHLKPVTDQLHDNAMLTDDDELWIIRCPGDVNVAAFLNKDLTPQGKSKLKLDGQTYEGVMDCESGNISIMSSEQSGFLIKNLPLKGCLNLRKRIPKTLTQVDAGANSMSSFIPLPETKCRHPLFGSNYRKAIKLRSSVAECLKQACRSPLPDLHVRLNKKKHKKNKKHQDSPHSFNSSSKADPSHHSPVKPEPESDHSHSYHKKKRKQNSLESNKQTNHDLESAEAWESEQAIEENLFNF